MIALKDLCEEIKYAKAVGDSDEKMLKKLEKVKYFWDFNKWHIKNHFGLKYFIVNDTLEYQDDLTSITGEDKEHSIDDFIVYGNECVFGCVVESLKKER